ncbi:MAG: cell division protein FtsQ/DivIB [Elusimicrobiota bacterium]
MSINSKKVLSWFFLLMVVSIAGKFGWDFLSNMDRLTLKPRSIKITGNKMVSDNKILSLLDNYYDRSLLKLDIDNLEQEVESLNRVRKSDIIRDFPDGLIIEISEIKPIGYMMKSGKRYVVTDRGVTFPGVEGPPLKFKVDGKDKIVKISKLLNKIKQINNDFYNNIMAINLNYKEDVIIHLRRGVRMIWPTLSKLNKNVIKNNIYIANKAEKEYADRRKENIKNIDMRYIETDMKNKIDGAVIVK